MKKICLTAVYFGTWPIWFPAFLASCVANQDIHWLIITDCEIEGLDFPNIEFVSMSMEDFNQRASGILGIEVRKKPYTHDDLRPAYGHIFADFYQSFDFWGHVDVDVVWGNIRKFVSDDKLNDCDILSSRENAFAGHFTVYRNDAKINAIYQRHPDWKRAMSEGSFHHFNERGMGIFFKWGLPEDLNGSIRVQWSKSLVFDWWELFLSRNGWNWRNGGLFDRAGREHMYIHFMTWKPHMRRIDFAAGDLPEHFSVNPRGIWSQPMSALEKIGARFPLRFMAESYARYAAWYWLDRQKWIRYLRPEQHANRDRSKGSI